MYRDSGQPGRRRKKRGGLLPAFLLILFSLVLVLFAAYRFLDSRKLKEPYVTEERLPAMLAGRTDENPAAIPFAEQIAVVRDDLELDMGISGGGSVVCPEDGGDAVYALRAFTRMHPASTTKIMTCLVALENGVLSDKVTAGNEIDMGDTGASVAGVRLGDTLTLEQLLYGLMLPSGGDAANMIALHIAGSEEAFVDLMNERTHSIGALGTHFTNTHGLTDDRHYSTPYDLYLIMREAMKNETFRKIAGARNYTAEFTDALGNPATLSWTNSNQFVNGKQNEPAGLRPVAGKTGTTSAAGHCLALVSADEEGKLWYSVMLRAKDRASLYEDMRIVLEYARK